MKTVSLILIAAAFLLSSCSMSVQNEEDNQLNVLEPVFTDIAAVLESDFLGPVKKEMLWYSDEAPLQPEAIESLEIFFPRVTEELAWTEFMRQLGFENTEYRADGTVASATGYYREGIGCIVWIAAEGWKDSIENGESMTGTLLESEGEVVPFGTGNPYREVTVSCSMLEVE